MLRGKRLFQFSLLFSLLLLVTAPSLPLHLWVLPIILTFYSQTLIRSLWISIAIGLLMDLLGSHDPLGIFTLATAATTPLLYRNKRHFFEDSLTTLPILSALYSSIFSLFVLLLSNPYRIGWKLLATDIFLLPLADGALIFTSITLPLFFFKGSRLLPHNAATQRPK